MIKQHWCYILVYVFKYWVLWWNVNLQLDLPCLGAQELLRNKHICRRVSKLRPRLDVEKIYISTYIWYETNIGYGRSHLWYILYYATLILVYKLIWVWVMITSNRSLSATISTASCSSPKLLTHAVPPQEAVLTLNPIVLIASPIDNNNEISDLSGVAFVRNSSYKN